MDITNSVALVTGANRGFGRVLARQLLERGATVYAAARDPRKIDLPGVIPLRLDIVDPESVARAAEEAGDVTLLINNAGIGGGGDLLTGDLDRIRLLMETHFFGTLGVTRAFAPVIEANGGGAVLNVLSALSWVHFASVGAYAAAKAAAWAQTDAVREQLAPRGIRVSALHVSFMDTDMAAHLPAEQKVSPEAVARLALDGIAAGEAEILADEVTRTVKAGLSAAR